MAKASYEPVAGNLLGKMAKTNRSDILPVTRSLIRHDEKAVADALIAIYNRSI